MHSRRELADDFRSLSVTAGDTVMVHASVPLHGFISLREPAGNRILQRQHRVGSERQGDSGRELHRCGVSWRRAIIACARCSGAMAATTSGPITAGT